MRFGKKLKEADSATKKGEASSTPFVDQAKSQDRYMNLAIDKSNWQLAFRITAAILAISVSINGYYVMSSKFIPYYVEVDKMGHVISVGVGTPAAPVDFKRVVRAEMIGWVESTRRVVSDQAAQKFFLRKAYARVEEGSRAKKALDRFVAETKPFEAAAKSTTEPTITYALARSDSTYEIEWVETKIAPNGDKIGEERWKGVFTYKLAAPETEAAIRANGAGFYMTDFQWSKNNG
ncbi:type IV secretion system protein [Agrobacterium tumefaciens]|uniref:type IV secretion system protein n=1 Tax=Agrobacterium tumefaciens TaxID=358 RepID=UPI0015728A4D|nr:type IV secretion system protein [Agrobacterium tumefaciens]NTB05918.1 type IV secretion system protein [Agrobacterium tumefaciens]